MQQVLLIDDDKRLAQLLVRYLSDFDIRLTGATRPSTGFKLLQNGDFDLVILDVMLPEMDGFEVCKRIRKNSDVPIVMLTARGEVMDRVVGLELGADDYLPKPFEPRELVARIQSILKRVANPATGKTSYHAGPLTVDTALRQASLDKEVLALSTMEYQLLELLVRQAGKTFTRDEILNRLKGIDTEIYSRSVDILVSRLRQKLKPHELIKTIRGSGYCIVGKVE